MDRDRAVTKCPQKSVLLLTSSQRIDPIIAAFPMITASLFWLSIKLCFLPSTPLHKEHSQGGRRCAAPGGVEGLLQRHVPGLPGVAPRDPKERPEKLAREEGLRRFEPKGKWSGTAPVSADSKNTENRNSQILPHSIVSGRPPPLPAVRRLRLRLGRGHPPWRSSAGGARRPRNLPCPACPLRGAAIPINEN